MFAALPAPRPQAATLAVGDVAYPNGFPALRAEITEVVANEDGTYSFRGVWLVTARGVGNLQAREGRPARFRQDAYGNATGQKAN